MWPSSFSAGRTCSAPGGSATLTNRSMPPPPPVHDFSCEDLQFLVDRLDDPVESVSGESHLVLCIQVFRLEDLAYGISDTFPVPAVAQTHSTRLLELLDHPRKLIALIF